MELKLKKDVIKPKIIPEENINIATNIWKLHLDSIYLRNVDNKPNFFSIRVKSIKKSIEEIK